MSSQKGFRVETKDLKTVSWIENKQEILRKDTPYAWETNKFNTLCVKQMKHKSFAVLESIIIYSSPVSN